MLNRFFNFLLLLFLSTSSRAQEGTKESDLKAAFLYNFTRYVDWDNTRARNEFVIGIIGSSPIIGPLNQIAKSNTVKNRKIIIRRFSRPDEIADCQILFIPQKIPFSLSSILERVDKGVLTVSEEYGFARQGTELNFVIVNNKLKFEANLEAILSAGLRVSSKLLKLAIIVE